MLTLAISTSYFSEFEMFGPICVTLEGFLFYGNRILTYFYGEKRKYSVIYTDFGHKKSDGNGNSIFQRVGKWKLLTE